LILLFSKRFVLDSMPCSVRRYQSSGQRQGHRAAFRQGLSKLDTAMEARIRLAIEEG
jgi:hypothetical protein